MDNISKAKRSEIMSKVKSVNSKAELRVRSRLHSLGYRFRLYDKKLPGNPDVVLKKYRIVLFIHGCFWHRHTCKRATMPSSNCEYWTNKFKRNVQRFKEVSGELKKQGWKVLVIWECQTKKDMIDLWVDRNLKPLK